MNNKKWYKVVCFSFGKVVEHEIRCGSANEARTKAENCWGRILSVDFVGQGQRKKKNKES